MFDKRIKMTKGFKKISVNINLDEDEADVVKEIFEDIAFFLGYEYVHQLIIAQSKNEIHTTISNIEKTDRKDEQEYIICAKCGRLTNNHGMCSDFWCCEYCDTVTCVDCGGLVSKGTSGCSFKRAYTPCYECCSCGKECCGQCI